MQQTEPVQSNRQTDREREPVTPTGMGVYIEIRGAKASARALLAGIAARPRRHPQPHARATTERRARERLIYSASVQCDARATLAGDNLAQCDRMTQRGR